MEIKLKPAQAAILQEYGKIKEQLQSEFQRIAGEESKLVVALLEEKEIKLAPQTAPSFDGKDILTVVTIEEAATEPKDKKESKLKKA